MIIIGRLLTWVLRPRVPFFNERNTWWPNGRSERGKGNAQPLKEEVGNAAWCCCDEDDAEGGDTWDFTVIWKDRCERAV